MADLYKKDLGGIPLRNPEVVMNTILDQIITGKDYQKRTDNKLKK